ncbi:hypothetical protein PIB30_076581 [Stylosanthes scabra]|uniref:Uncharacterized protein n=1 Tax=Stylosanthes scabra TaxID=79078 RepID=A0ABU6WQ62_9FABA|nr:hypothetical protein [Stylosanthes scabra]
MDGRRWPWVPRRWHRCEIATDGAGTGATNEVAGTGRRCDAMARLDGAARSRGVVDGGDAERAGRVANNSHQGWGETPPYRH